MRHFSPPPTKFGAIASAQTKPTAIGKVVATMPPPSTKFGAITAAQNKPAATGKAAATIVSRFTANPTQGQNSGNGKALQAMTVRKNMTEERFKNDTGLIDKNYSNYGSLYFSEYAVIGSDNGQNDLVQHISDHPDHDYLTAYISYEAMLSGEGYSLEYNIEINQKWLELCIKNRKKFKIASAYVRESMKHLVSAAEESKTLSLKKIKDKYSGNYNCGGTTRAEAIFLLSRGYKWSFIHSHLYL